MIIHVNYRYEAAVIGKGKRTPVEKTYLGSEAVEVREVSGRDAPVAMRFKTDAYYDAAPNQVLELRWEGGKLWCPSFDVEGNRSDEAGQTVTRRECDWLVEYAESAHAGTEVDGYPFPTGKRNWHSDPVARPIDEDGEVGRVKSSMVDERAAEVRAAAEKILLVDGVPHFTCREPVYTIKWGRGSEQWVSAGFAEPSSMASGVERIFRADELDWMTDVSLKETVPEEDRIEILVPEAVNFDGPGYAVIQSTQAMLESFKNRIAENDVEFFVAYAALRDGLKKELASRSRQERPDPDALAVAELARTALAAVEGVEGLYLDRVKRALERVDARCLSADFAFAP